MKPASLNNFTGTYVSKLPQKVYNQKYKHSKISK